MKSLIVTLAVGLGVLAFASPASAQYRYGGGRYYYPGYHQQIHRGGWPGHYHGGYRYSYPAYRYAYPRYGWGYPAYGWGFPGYGWGGYPGYGWGYPGVNVGIYRPGFSLGFTIPIR